MTVWIAVLALPFPAILPCTLYLASSVSRYSIEKRSYENLIGTDPATVPPSQPTTSQENPELMNPVLEDVSQAHEEDVEIGFVE